MVLAQLLVTRVVLNVNKPRGGEHQLQEMADTAAEAARVLSELDAQKPLSIISLGSTISPEAVQDGEKRASGVSDSSANAMENATPASLVAELAHYKVRLDTFVIYEPESPIV